MSIDVFNRFEKKYLLDLFQYNNVLQTIEKHMTLDPFNQKEGVYTISNIYYDTCDDLLIKKSLSKPIYKEKLRLRAYGTPDMDSKVYLEIKKKVAGLVNKRRTHIALADAYTFIESKMTPSPMSYQNRQVIKEIHFFLSRYEIFPSVFIAYDRKAYALGNFRVTFDHNIRTRRYDLSLELGSHGKQLLEDGQWLMEVKSDHALPLWFVKCLSDNHLYATSFSKYGTEYKIKKGELQTCLSPFLTQQAAVR